MAATKPELRSQLRHKIATLFHRLLHMFGVQQFSSNLANTARCNRKSEIQDGGRQTGSTYTSASTAFKRLFPKMWGCRWNDVAILYRSCDIYIYISDFTSVFLNFGFPVTWGVIRNNSLEFLDPENRGIRCNCDPKCPRS